MDAQTTRLIVVITFAVLLLTSLTVKAQQDILTLSKDTFKPYEKVEFFINTENLAADEFTLRLQSDTDNYKYSGPVKDKISFIPEHEGTYTVSVSVGKQLLDSEVFEVKQEEVQLQEVEVQIQLEKDEYSFGEQILITAQYPDDHELVIINEQKVYKFLGQKQEEVMFFAPRAGAFEVQIQDRNGEVVASQPFTVTPTQPALTQKQEPQGKYTFTIKDSRGQDLSATIKLFNKQKTQLSFDDIRENSMLNLKAEFEGLQLKEANLENLVFDKEDLELKLEEVPNPDSREFTKIYSVDSSQLNFTNATFTARAKGKKLYKCSDWDFNTQTCLGAWEKIKDLVPGQTYTLQITPESAGYAEAGLLTINPDKYEYLLNDESFISMAVLDPYGVTICEAELDLIITSPTGITNLSTENGAIQLSDECIFKAYSEIPDYYSYFNITEIGNYSLNLTAYTEFGVLNSLSSFESKNTLQYNVRTEGPTRVYPPANYTFNYTIIPAQTEQVIIKQSVPINLTIAPSSDFTLIQNSTHNILVWDISLEQGVPTIIEFEFDPPDIWPWLWLIGPLQINNWQEGRLWEIASDATTMTDQDITATPNPVIVNTTISVTANYYCTGGGAAWNGDIWIVDDGVQIDTTSANRDFYCEGTGNVSVDLCEADSCSVNADCSVTITTCAQFDDVDITWTLVPNSENEALNSTHLLEPFGTSGNYNDDVTVNINELEDSAPVISREYPPDNYWADDAQPKIVEFNCSGTDDYDVVNISLYMTDPDNRSFAWNATCDIATVNGSCWWNVSMRNGNYSWNCIVEDDAGQTDWGRDNRSITINWSAPSGVGPAVVLNSPANGSRDGDGNVNLSCTASDFEDIVNVTLYHNISGWAMNQTINYTGGADTSVIAIFNLTNIANNTLFEWYCEAYDSDNEVNVSEFNWTVNVTTTVKPEVYLVSPADNYNTSSNSQSFTCYVIDDQDIQSVSLFTNRTGPFTAEAQNNYPGKDNIEVTATFSIKNMLVDKNFEWNCRAYDNDTTYAYAPNNRTIDVNLTDPTVILSSPDDLTYDVDGDITFECNVTDDQDITNITIYTSMGGAFEANQTLTYSGSGQTSITAQFNLTDFPKNSHIIWNCLAYDNNSLSDWGDSNRTVSVPPPGQPFFAQDSGGTWSNPSNAEGIPDEVTADEELDNQLNLITYNWANLPEKGTLLEIYLSLEWWMSAAPDNDDLYLQYSDDNGTTWYDMAGNAGQNTLPTSYPLSRTNQSYQITSGLTWADLTSLRLRLTGNQDTGPDDVVAKIDSLFITMVWSPPPTPYDIKKNATVIYENDSVMFFTNWTDDIGLGCFIFSINQSDVFENVSSCIDLDGHTDQANFAFSINATAGNIVEWMFYANDSHGVWNNTPIQRFTVSDANDNQTPTILSVNVTPFSAKSLSTFTITANITDNIDVLEAWAEITTPSGVKTNYSMTDLGGVTWTREYVGMEGGNYTVIVYASDYQNNTNVSDLSASFKVTSLVQTQFTYYERGEMVSITGYGFTANSLVSVDVINEAGTSQGAFPTNVNSDADGNISTTWGIPGDLTSDLDNYTIFGNDTTYGYLENDTEIQVIIRPDIASKVDDNFPAGTDVKQYVNNSENSTTTLVGDDIYLQAYFNDNIEAGYTLDDLILYVEHEDKDAGNDPLNVQYYDGAAYQAATCGTITFSATETIGSCNLTADLASIPNPNNIRIRLTDGGVGAAGTDFSIIDFVFLHIEFSITDALAITIEEPAYETETYDFSDSTNNDAYHGGATTAPPGSQVTGTEANAQDYANLSTSNNKRWQTYTTTSGEHAYQSFYFKINEPDTDLNTFTLTFEGYATERTNYQVDDFHIYIYNYSSGAYEQLGATVSGDTQDITVERQVTGTVGNYTSPIGQVNIVVEADYVLAGCGNPANCRGDVYTDYIKLEVNTIPTIAGTQDINVTAIDSDGVSTCNYWYRNSSSSDGPVFQLEFQSGVEWLNKSDTNVYENGIYDIYVNCTDSGGEENSSEFVRVRVLNDPPTVYLSLPLNNANRSTSSVLFRWNVSNPAGGNPTCNVSIDGTVQAPNIVSTNEEFTNTTIAGISDGNHGWNVTCWDIPSLTNTSETWYFDVDTTAPSVNLNNPAPNYFSNASTIFFYYTPTDTHNIKNCSLIIDDSIITTNTTIYNNSQNNFSYTLSEGKHVWAVNCSDEWNYTGFSGNRTITIDLGNPTIQLHEPEPEENFVGGLVKFNYTAYDDIDTQMYCDIVVDGVVEDNDVPSTNATPVVRYINLGDGIKQWNVTCRDRSYRYNTSDTWNFSVSGPPTVILHSPSNNTATSLWNITLNYTAEDTSGIENCSLWIDGQFNQSNWTGVDESGLNNFTVNLSVEKSYTWTVECYDKTGSNTKPAARTIFIDRTKPTIGLIDPEIFANYTENDVDFNFTVNDNMDSTLTCNLTINDNVNASNMNFAVANNTQSWRNETGLDSGFNYWNVTCWDDAMNVNTSETWYFFIGGIPTVQLISPENNTHSKENVSFNYYVYDSSGIQACTLMINMQPNQTESNIANGADQYFYLYNLTEQTFNWTINCTNNNSNMGWAENWTLTIDNTKPTIDLHYPNELITTDTDITFNFTVNDNNATRLLCNLSINGTVNQSEFWVNEGEFTTKTVTDFTEGTYNWNVSCFDNASNYNTSMTFNFTISFGPSVSLSGPPDNNVTEDTNITFTYTLNAPSGLSNCSLLINGSINQTKNGSGVPFTAGGNLNNFTIWDEKEQIINWTVLCVDLNGLNSTLNEYRILHIDFYDPNITLHAPENNSNISYTTVTFNFTPFDSLDNILECNITVNESGYNVYWINATEGEPHTEDVSGFTAGGYAWYVTCSDGIHLNTSVTYYFEITPYPNIELKGPDDNATLSDTTVTFSYIASTIALGPPPGFQYCQVIIDGQNGVTDFAVNNNGLDSIVNQSVLEGSHTWAIFCLDQDNFNATSENRTLYIDLTYPNVTANYPDGHNISIGTVDFNWTATDNMDSSLACYLEINDSLLYATLVANTTTTYQVTGLDDGFQYWNVTCYDNANRSNMSERKNFTIKQPPSIAIDEPANNNRTNDVNVTFVFTPTDNSDNISNCTLILNNATNVTNSTVFIDTQNNLTPYDLVKGEYNWSINCTDVNGNENESETMRLIIDLDGPTIDLNYPIDNITLNNNNVSFNFTPTDNYATTLNCNISVDGSVNQTNFTITSGEDFIVNISDFTSGTHNWSINCTDDLGNSNGSTLQFFIVNSPDLQLFNDNLSFNDSNPELLENITIFANVTNDGGYPANDLNVSFWEGNPENGGTWIGSTIGTVAVNTTVAFNVTWIIDEGFHTIFVIVDPTNAIEEMNETNNNATINITLLISNITHPPNGTLTPNSTYEINFTLQDFTNGSINYNVYVNDAVDSSGSVTDNESTPLNITLSEGYNYVIVEAIDALSRRKNSSNITIISDQNPPIPTFITANRTFFNTNDANISFNITDNVDDNINYTFYLNGAVNITGNVTNGTAWYEVIPSLTNGSYTLIIEAFDDVNRTANSTELTFYIDQVLPTINLAYPPNNSIFTTTTSVDLNFSVVDNLANSLFCNLTFDSILLRQNYELENNTILTTVISDLNETTYYWNVTCIDNATNTNSSDHFMFSVFIPPNVTLYSPGSNHITKNQTINFTYNVSDDTGLTNCSLLLNGEINITVSGSDITLDAINNFTVSGLNGTYNWSVMCFDNTSQEVYSITNNWTLTVDPDQPQPFIETLNNAWFNTANPGIDYNISDEIDRLINYTWYVDGAPNTEGVVVNATSNTSILTGLTNGSHTIVLEAIDDALNLKNSTSITINIDDDLPTIYLYNPIDEENFTTYTITFNYSVIDWYSSNLTCNITVDDQQVALNYTLNNSLINVTYTASVGYHGWNVTCIDNAGNTNTSHTWHFNISAPDLLINSGNISFNDTNPQENENITINATIFNIGSNTAYNFTVQFYSGNPDAGGTQINGDINVTALGPGQNITVNITYNISLGTNIIFVFVDTPTATNGSIVEVDETNNNASRSITVGFWHFVAGNTTAALHLQDLTNITLYWWNVTNGTGSNVFVADSDSTIEFISLQALTRDTGGGLRSEDFEDSDFALHSENYSDNITNTYSVNNVSKETKTFMVFAITIQNVPVVNSTNSSVFKTGILWDKSDGGANYDQSQDLVFITEVNESGASFAGTADYEIRIPSTLRSLVGGGDTVSFYTEVK